MGSHSRILGRSLRWFDLGSTWIIWAAVWKTVCEGQNPGERWGWAGPGWQQWRERGLCIQIHSEGGGLTMISDGLDVGVKENDSKAFGLTSWKNAIAINWGTTVLWGLNGEHILWSLAHSRYSLHVPFLSKGLWVTLLLPPLIVSQWAKRAYSSFSLLILNLGSAEPGMCWALLHERKEAFYKGVEQSKCSTNLSFH